LREAHGVERDHVAARRVETDRAFDQRLDAGELLLAQRRAALGLADRDRDGQALIRERQEIGKWFCESRSSYRNPVI
jgi:hypothetical protein